MFVDGDRSHLLEGTGDSKEPGDSSEGRTAAERFGASRNSAQCSVTVSQERGVLPLWKDKPQSQQL